MKVIYSSRNIPLLVDDCDYERVAQYSWHHQPAGYFFALKRIGGGRRLHFYIHRIVMDAKPGEIVDHIDHDLTNNTRANLRLCDNSLNHGNARKFKTNTSGYKGVRWNGYSYIAKVTFRGVTYHLGSFDTIREACEAYNRGAIHHFGEFALLNPVP